MTSRSPINHATAIGPVLGALEQVHEAIDAHGLPRPLHHLVQLRASQMNQCAYCVKMHIREAREDQERAERLDRLVVWEHVSDYSPAEKAALRWTEALTALQPHTDYGALRASLREHFDDAQIGALTATIAMINLWNRIQISSH